MTGQLALDGKLFVGPLYLFENHTPERVTDEYNRLIGHPGKLLRC